MCSASWVFLSVRQVNHKIKTSSLTRFIGGAERVRTADLLNAIQTRSQLRHSPETWDARGIRPEP